ncbi:MAG: aminotransferase class IV [Planctomycetota bacterium]
MEQVFVNGTFVARGEAKVSAFDAGLTHGIGLFETMSARRGPDGPEVSRLGDHLERLTTSAAQLSLSADLNQRALAEAIHRTAATALDTDRSPDRLRLRLTVTGGDLNMLTAARPTTPAQSQPNFHPTIILDVQPATSYPDEMFEKGVRVAAADTRANPLNSFEGHKTLNYWWRLRELQVAAGRGAAEALVFSVTNHAVGGCVSNVFAVRDGTLLSPIARGEEPDGGLPSPVLPGVTRKAVFDAADAACLTADTRMLSFEDLATADELFLTNSSWGILPVVGIENRTISSGIPGEITRSLLETLNR